jgi:3-methyladenine DNA glycosylase/8-oxoguanine DNA glycosylase
MPAAVAPPVAVSLLASDRRRAPAPPAAVVALDRARRGSVAAAAPGGVVRRAEPGPAGPLVLEAAPARGEVHLQVWGPGQTPGAAVDQAMTDLTGWVGLADRPAGFAEVIAGDERLRQLHRHLGTPVLSRMPEIGEAVGRAVLFQLVQTTEARRSAAQLVSLAGTRAGHGLWCWPTPAQVGALHAFQMRPCGVPLRGARALHAAALHDRRLREARTDWALLDRRLRALPGVGAWTSAETRLALGDPDAVSVGDYNLPGLIGHVLAGAPTDDAGMLELLGPFAGQRGRVIRLVGAAVRAGLVEGPRRRAPRAALSAHRYW